MVLSFYLWFCHILGPSGRFFLWPFVAIFLDRDQIWNIFGQSIFALEVQSYLFVLHWEKFGAFFFAFFGPFGPIFLGPTYVNNQLWFWKYSLIFLFLLVTFGASFALFFCSSGLLFFYSSGLFYLILFDNKSLIIYMHAQSQEKNLFKNMQWSSIRKTVPSSVYRVQGKFWSSIGQALLLLFFLYGGGALSKTLFRPT